MLPYNHLSRTIQLLFYRFAPRAPDYVIIDTQNGMLVVCFRLFFCFVKTAEFARLRCCTTSALIISSVGEYRPRYWQPPITVHSKNKCWPDRCINRTTLFFLIEMHGNESRRKSPTTPEHTHTQLQTYWLVLFPDDWSLCSICDRDTVSAERKIKPNQIEAILVAVHSIIIWFGFVCACVVFICLLSHRFSQNKIYIYWRDYSVLIGNLVLFGFHFEALHARPVMLPSSSPSIASFLSICHRDRVWAVNRGHLHFLLYNRSIANARLRSHFNSIYNYDYLVIDNSFYVSRKKTHWDFGLVVWIFSLHWKK